jgi:hypothetical protein
VCSVFDVFDSDFKDPRSLPMISWERLEGIVLGDISQHDRTRLNGTLPGFAVDSDQADRSSQRQAQT